MCAGAAACRQRPISRGRTVQAKGPESEDREMTGRHFAGSSSRNRWAVCIGAAIFMGLFCLAPLAAEAQSAGKRSGASVKRGSSSVRLSSTPERRSSATLPRTGAEKKGSPAAVKQGAGSISGQVLHVRSAWRGDLSACRITLPRRWAWGLEGEGSVQREEGQGR